MNLSDQIKRYKVCNVLKRFKVLVENQNCQKIVVLRTNKDGEYTSRAFEALCVNHGIQHEDTTPYTP